MIVYMNVDHLDISFFIYKVFNKNERLNVNVWVAKEALTLIFQRSGKFKLNLCLMKLCWRKNNACLPSALRRKKNGRASSPTGRYPSWIWWLNLSLPQTALDLLLPSNPAGAGVRRIFAFAFWWLRGGCRFSEMCVFIEDASWRSIWAHPSLEFYYLYAELSCNPEKLSLTREIPTN